MASLLGWNAWARHEFVEHGTVAQLQHIVGIDAESIAQVLQRMTQQQDNTPK